MFKTLALLKRRPGMSREDFIAYYEANHARLGEKYILNPVRYARNYLTPMPYPITGETFEGDFDVVTEIWFEDRAAFDAYLAAISNPDIQAEILEDEAKLFDLTKCQMFFVEERESVLP